MSGNGNWARIYGAGIREMRTRRGLTQGALAELMEMKRHHLSDWEQGKHRPSDANLERLAAILDCDVTELFTLGRAAIAA